MIFYALFFFFWPLYGFIDSSAEEMTENRMRERGSDRQQRAPGRDSNPGPLQRGQSICTLDACPTNCAKQCPLCLFVFNTLLFIKLCINLLTN